MNFREFLKNNIVVLDGGTGSLLQAKGLPVGKRPEVWNYENPQALIDIHKSYYDAGSNVVNTNTFGANCLNFDDAELEKIVSSAIYNVKKAAELSSSKKEKFVSFDIGPTGKLLKPYGDLDFEDAVSVFAQVAKLAEKYGADLISIETMNDGYETKAALLAAKENTSLPVIVTNAYNDDENLLTGASPEAMTAMLEGLGADAIGLNCSFGPDKLMGVIKRILEVASVPVVFKPNAGIPRSENGVTVFDITADHFASLVASSVDLGVNIVGGCCGTTPEYIKKVCDLVKDKTYNKITDKDLTVVSSKTHCVTFGKRPVIIGERINPTGKKLIKEALRTNDFDYIFGEAVKQKNSGANVLDVNCGLPDIDEASVLTQVVYGLQSVCDLPLQIDTSSADAMEKALRIYNGKAMINSVNGKQEVLDAVLPLAAKYGGVIVALTLDENGIPDSAKGRLVIAERIIKEAEKYDISKKNLVFDPLTLTVSADSSAAKITLESVKLIREMTGCNTVLGVSNVSFGLPCRDNINSSFFTLALYNGLTSAIINPMSVPMMTAYNSYLALCGIDENCLDYIDFCKSNNPDSSVSNSVVKEDKDLKALIVSGFKDSAAKATEALLADNEPLTVVNDYIIPALDIVGKNFENKVAYLPELLMSAESAKSCFDVIKTKFSAGNKNKFNIVLATVKGDIHDIGKNIVKLLLENYGYNVIDLGKDVPADEVLKAAKEFEAPLVGLSALMTTTVPAMEETVTLIHKELPGCKVVVGGAVLTEEYAKSIGADKYSADAMETVRFAESLI